MKLKYFLLLVCANAAWAINPTAAKILITEVGPMQTALIKFGGAWLVLNLFQILTKVSGRDVLGLHCNDVSAKRLCAREAAFIGVISLTTFFLSPLLQMNGLQASSAANNSLLVAMEPVLTVLLSFLFFRVPVGRRNALALVLTIFGFFVFVDLRALLTSAVSSSAAISPVALGDFLIFGAIACEACYSVFSEQIINKVSGFKVYYLALTLGFSYLCVVFLFQGHGFDVSGFSLKGLIAGLWIGPIGTAFTYLIWIRIIEAKVPVAIMVLTLLLQPILGVIFGVCVLGESLQAHQIIGGLIILVSMAFGMLRGFGVPALK